MRLTDDFDKNDNPKSTAEFVYIPPGKAFPPGEIHSLANAALRKLNTSLVLLIALDESGTENTKSSVSLQTDDPRIILAVPDMLRKLTDMLDERVPPTDQW